MKKALLAAFALTMIVSIYGCKKCYTCKNECTNCAIVVNGNTFQRTYCSTDTAYANTTISAYRADVAADSASGYTCTVITSTYEDDYCTNKPGEDPYKTYYNAGGKVFCSEK